jgi:hypothetical protein
MNTPTYIKERLEYIRGELRAERVSYSELAELQGLAEYIEPGDVELLEAAGVPEFPKITKPSVWPRATSGTDGFLFSAKNMEHPCLAIHNGVFTLTSPKSGHRTFQIKTLRKGPLKDKRIVSLLIGPNNEADYQGFGFVSNDGIALWNKCRGFGSPYLDYADVLWSLATEGEDGRYYKAGYRMLVSGTCVRCNRKLSTPESLARGLGPECFGRI